MSSQCENATPEVNASSSVRPETGACVRMTDAYKAFLRGVSASWAGHIAEYGEDHGVIVKLGFNGRLADVRWTDGKRFDYRVSDLEKVP